MHLLLIGVGLVVGLAAPSAARIREATHAAYEAAEYQRVLPGQQDPVDLVPWKLGRRARRAAPRSPPPPIPRTPIANVLLWGTLIGGAVLALAWLVTRWLGYAGADPKAVPRGAPADEAERARLTDAPLGDAEALARAGRFGEAVHVLLLRTFEALGRGGALAPHLTSREIVARVPLNDDARDALGALVTTVEVSLFGGALVDAEDYARCVAAFRRVRAVA